MKVEVRGHFFEAELYEGETAAAFAGLLPLRLYMQELNGNEKYHYLSSPLPSEPEMVESIQAGDIMLFDSSCVVLFYDSFDTPYSYTRIGRVKDPSGLKEAVGEGDCQVSFSLN